MSHLLPWEVPRNASTSLGRHSVFALRSRADPGHASPSLASSALSRLKGSKVTIRKKPGAGEMA